MPIYATTEQFTILDKWHPTRDDVKYRQCIMKTQRFTQAHTGVQTQYMYTHTHRYTDSLNEPSEAADLSITLAYCTTRSYVASSRLAVLGCHNHCRQHTCPCGIPSSAWLSPCSCGCCIHWFSGTPCIVT